MDIPTINSYNNEAEKIAKLHASLTPHRIYELIDQYFIKGKLTADIGCGIGRDTNFLDNQGFSVVGVDGSEGMLEQARLLYPNLNFQLDYLPTLVKFENLKFQNILCSAVLMHLNESTIEAACFRLVELLKKDGRLIISIRGTNEKDKRESGKLYEVINIESLKKLFEKNGCEILLHESEVEQNRGLTWHNFAIKK
jgi:2-polyprenyl-3-methyl-5-hydroxy-6-metoxy-1,4-benzoquinol methylase